MKTGSSGVTPGLKKHKKSTSIKSPSKSTSTPVRKTKQAKHPGGCPTKRTPKARAKILEAISLGATYQLAANYAGMHYDTLNEWRKDDAEFSDALTEAEGKAACKWLKKIEAAAARNWLAAAWKLERRYPAQYGRTVSQTEVTGKDGGPVLTVRLPDDWGGGTGGR
ncbi:MAG: hypothetical protein KJ050_16340 [Candidatus Omnitrophica bacterium]|nr:hypothetical protein [Candidatus Omnitrophota bacterium]